MTTAAVASVSCTVAAVAGSCLNSWQAACPAAADKPFPKPYTYFVTPLYSSSKETCRLWRTSSLLRSRCPRPRPPPPNRSKISAMPPPPPPPMPSFSASSPFCRHNSRIAVAAIAGYNALMQTWLADGSEAGQAYAGLAALYMSIKGACMQAHHQVML